MARASAERDRLTLGALVTAWKQLHLTERRASYSHEAVRALRHGFAGHWGKPAESLERRDVVAALDALQKAGHRAMASRTGAYGRAAFQWALKRGALLANPFSSLPAIGASAKRTRVLSDAELAAVWKAAEAMPSPFGRIVRLLALTGQRKAEVAEMPWSELSEDLSIWTIEPEADEERGAACCSALRTCGSNPAGDTARRGAGAAGRSPRFAVLRLEQGKGAARRTLRCDRLAIA